MNKAAPAALGRNVFLIIYRWMMTELSLSGCELMVYAAIFSFSRTKDGRFHSSVDFLAEMTNQSSRNVKRCLSSLTEKGLIEKERVASNGTYFFDYYIKNAEELLSRYSEDGSGSPKNDRGRARTKSGASVNTPYGDEEYSGGDSVSQHGVTNYARGGDNSARREVTDSHTKRDNYSPHSNYHNNDHNNFHNRWARDARDGREEKFVSKYAGFDIDDAIARALERSNRDDW